MKLYVFNPDTDMALAHNNENYLAPASVRQMAEDLALLPIWYAQPGSAVLTPSAYNADYLKEMQQLFSLSVQLVTEPELPEYSEVQIIPWGWNRAIRKRMLKGGMQKLPSLLGLEAYRGLASRGYSMVLFTLFSLHKIDYVCGYSRFVEGDGPGPVSPEIMDDFKDGAVFKSLWSGSGKGLFWCRHGFTKAAADWCNHALKEHGDFMMEPIYNKVEDFAMEFYSNGQGKVLFLGYSRFTTDEKGSYRGNTLTSDKQVEEWIQQYIPLEAFVRIRGVLQRGLDGIYGSYYTGYLGVDMMVCRQEGEHPYVVHPHVEVNLRTTMGIVSHQLYNNFVNAGSGGIFSIDHYPSNEALRAQHEQDMRDYPLVVENGRIVSGYLALVPITPRSRYRAYVRVALGG